MCNDAMLPFMAEVPNAIQKDKSFPSEFFDTVLDSCILHGTIFPKLISTGRDRGLA
ncbi:MAG: hypothetical protein AW11_00899 [Candidatus Accumulibacter regalis]|uniref:Uncharacterized protein n=1 Tax=Accumulibacter regalis TaxID=522306 RepID=A0A011PS06_ACCRE|nr:MAG: hypothetical protein AW11_00899 [Candidatus Accumulibacter regalis]